MMNKHFEEVQRRIRHGLTVANRYDVTFSFNGWGIAVREEENRFRVNNGGEMCPLAPILLLKRYATGLPSLEEEVAQELGVSLAWVDGFFDYRQLGQELDDWLGDFLDPDDSGLSDYQRGALAAADAVHHILFTLALHGGLQVTRELERNLMREVEWLQLIEPRWVIRRLDGQHWYCRRLGIEDVEETWVGDAARATQISGRNYAAEIAQRLTTEGIPVKVEVAPPW